MCAKNTKILTNRKTHKILGLNSNAKHFDPFDYCGQTNVLLKTITKQIKKQVSKSIYIYY